MLKKSSRIESRFSVGRKLLDTILISVLVGGVSVVNAAVYQDVEDVVIKPSTLCCNSENLHKGKVEDNGVVFITLREGTGVDVVSDSEEHRKDQHSFRFTTNAASSTSPGFKERTELGLINNVPFTIETWSGFSFKLSDSFFPTVASGRGQYLILHQWHQQANTVPKGKPQPGLKESPPIALRIKPGSSDVLQINIRYGKNAANHQEVKPSTAYPLEYRLKKGRWVDVIAQWKVSPDGDGIFKMWLDADIDDSQAPIIVADWEGPIGYTGLTDNTIDERFGIYKSRQNGLKHQIHYDEIRVDTSYCKVDPATVDRAECP